MAFLVSSLAFDRGWDILQPVTLPNFNIQTRAGRDDVRSYLQDADPDLRVITLPSEFRESQRQGYYNGPYQVRRSRRQRMEQLSALALVQEIVSGRQNVVEC